MLSNSHCRRTLRSRWPRSTSARRSSSRASPLFFEPVQFDLQAADFLIEGVVVRLLPTTRAFTLPAIHEKLLHLLQRGLPPFRDLDGMHLEVRSQLAERLLATDCLDRHPCFELRAVLFSRRRRHRPLLVNDSAENLRLLPGLKSWDHYNPGILLQAGHTQEGKPEGQRLAANLALKGFVVLAFDPAGQGEREQTYDRRIDRALAV